MKRAKTTTALVKVFGEMDLELSSPHLVFTDSQAVLDVVTRPGSTARKNYNFRQDPLPGYQSLTVQYCTVPGILLPLKHARGVQLVPVFFFRLTVSTVSRKAENVS